MSTVPIITTIIDEASRFRVAYGHDPKYIYLGHRDAALIDCFVEEMRNHGAPSSRRSRATPEDLRHGGLPRGRRPPPEFRAGATLAVRMTYGNAIVPQVAAEFIQACGEALT